MIFLKIICNMPYYVTVEDYINSLNENIFYRLGTKCIIHIKIMILSKAISY